MKIPVSFDCPELYQVDTAPPPQLEVDLAWLESAPKPSHIIVKHVICCYAPQVNFGVN